MQNTLCVHILKNTHTHNWSGWG